MIKKYIILILVGKKSEYYSGMSSLKQSMTSKVHFLRISSMQVSLLASGSGKSEIITEIKAAVIMHYMTTQVA